MATKFFCDRCDEEIKGTRNQCGSVIVKFDNLSKCVKDMLCESCTNDIVRSINTVHRAAPK